MLIEYTIQFGKDGVIVTQRVDPSASYKSAEVNTSNNVTISHSLSNTFATSKGSGGNLPTGPGTGGNLPTGPGTGGNLPTGPGTGGNLPTGPGTGGVTDGAVVVLGPIIVSGGNASGQDVASAKNAIGGTK